jgi:hypothetical protein
MSMKNADLWEVMQCGSCKSLHFGVTNRLHDQGEKNQRARIALFLARWLFRSWWCRRFVTPKCLFLQEPHGVTSEETAFIIVTAVKTSNLIELKTTALRRMVEWMWGFAFLWSRQLHDPAASLRERLPRSRLGRKPGGSHCRSRLYGEVKILDPTGTWTLTLLLSIPYVVFILLHYRGSWPYVTWFNECIFPADYSDSTNVYKTTSFLIPTYASSASEQCLGSNNS